MALQSGVSILFPPIIIFLLPPISKCLHFDPWRPSEETYGPQSKLVLSIKDLAALKFMALERLLHLIQFYLFFTWWLVFLCTSFSKKMDSVTMSWIDEMLGASDQDMNGVVTYGNYFPVFDNLMDLDAILNEDTAIIAQEETTTLVEMKHEPAVAVSSPIGMTAYGDYFPVFDDNLMDLDAILKEGTAIIAPEETTTLAEVMHELEVAVSSPIIPKETEYVLADAVSSPIIPKETEYELAAAVSPRIVLKDITKRERVAGAVSVLPKSADLEETFANRGVEKPKYGRLDNYQKRRSKMDMVYELNGVKKAIVQLSQQLHRYEIENACLKDVIKDAFNRKGQQ